MKKLLFLLLLAISSFCTLRAQEVKTLFLAIPDSICPLLTAVNRADMIDFMDSNMKAEINNRFSTTSEMTRLTADYIHIRMTDRSTWEMKLLPLNDSIRIIGVISTACAPVCDSSVRFYSDKWEPLPVTSYFNPPRKEDFFLPAPPATAEYAKLYEKADVQLMKMSFPADSLQIKVQYTTPDFMVKEDAEKLREYLVPELTYLWSNGRFARQ